MSFVSAPRRFLPGLLSLCVVLSSPSVAKVQPLLSDAHVSYAAQIRMRNRARLLKQYHAQVKKQASYVVEGNAESKSALRQQNPALRLYYLSNMPEPYARTLEQRHDFFAMFDGGVFSGDVKLAKPDAAIYALLETRYALQPEHTVFIDDLAANITVAKARGWHGIQFESAPQVQTELDAWMASRNR